MSKVNINEDLFLEKAELNRMQDFLSVQGFNLRDTAKAKTFGPLVGANFKVSPSATVGEIKLSNQVNYAIDKSGRLIFCEARESLITVPNDNVSRYLCIRYKERKTETGTVTISAIGALSGVSTEFTKVLRGSQTNYPSVIKLSGSNSGEYIVQSVVDDTNCVLSGNFAPESGVKYTVIGTFTPGVVVPNNSKEVFRYDDVEFFFLTDLGYLVVDFEFTIAIVKKNGGVITECKDYRKTRFSIQETNELYNILDQNTNPLIGVESLIWEPKISNQSESIVRIGFGFVVSAFTVSHESSLITVTSGSGGFFKNSNDFVITNFNGWRIYSQHTGKYCKINASIKSGSNILCYMDAIFFDYIQNGDSLFIVPDAEEIQFQVCDSSGHQLNTMDSYITTPIKSCFVDIKLLQQRSGVVGNDNKYIIKYRYKSNYNYSELKSVLKNKYTREDGTSFDGTPYSDATLTLIRNPSSLITNQSGGISTYPLLNQRYYWDTFGDSKKIKFTGNFALSANRIIFLPAERGIGGKLLEKGTQIDVEWRTIVNPTSANYQISFATLQSQPIASGVIDPTSLPINASVLVLSASQLRRSNFNIRFTYLGSFNWQSELVYLQEDGNPTTGNRESDWDSLDALGTYLATYVDDSVDKARIKRTFDDVFFEGVVYSPLGGAFVRGVYTLFTGIPAGYCPKQDLTRAATIIENVFGVLTPRQVTLLITTVGEIKLNYHYAGDLLGTTTVSIYLGGISYKIINN